MVGLSFMQDLLRRRVPQIVGAYLAIGWGVMEFLDWLTGRYDLPPYLADLGLAAWACLIPTVVMLAYYQGERGAQRFRLVEKVGIPLNVAIAAVALTLVYRGRDPTAVGELTLDPTRIAVLYFDDESEREELGHLASAFTGALIDELTQVPALDVVPRSAVKPFRGRPAPLDSMAHVLRMGTLVEGSVSGSAERLIVSVTLIDPARQSAFASFSLEGTVEEWRDLRARLAADVAETLRERLGIEIRLRERRAATRNQRALGLLEQAEGLYKATYGRDEITDSSGVVRDLEQADTLLAEAERLDPRWTEPIVMRGWVAYHRAVYPALEFGKYAAAAMQTALRHVGRALELNPDDNGALELRGILNVEMSQDPKLSDQATELRAAAEQDLTAVVAADPFRARAWGALSTVYRLNTRFAEAKRSAERALEADPFLAQAEFVIWELHASSLELREMDEAVRWCEEGRRRFPGSFAFVSSGLHLMTFPGGPEPDADRAWRLADSLVLLASPQQTALFELLGHTWVAAALARAGLADSAIGTVRRARANVPDDLTPWADYNEAIVWVRLGKPDRALSLLESFVEAAPQYREYIGSDWTFQELWDDQRFKALADGGPR